MASKKSQATKTNETVELVSMLAKIDRKFSLRNPELLNPDNSESTSDDSLIAESQILAIAAERDRIAQRIHDGVAQSIYNIILSLTICEKLLASNPQSVEEKIRLCGQLAQEALTEIRHTIYDLKSLKLEDIGLSSAIEGYLKSFCGTNGIDFCFSVEGKEKDISPLVEESLYYSAKEGISNAVKHSKASEVKVKLEYGKKGDISLFIEDDGCGFEAEKKKPEAEESSKFGLCGMSRRAQALGGEFFIETSSNKGTKLTIVVPLNGKVDSDE